MGEPGLRAHAPGAVRDCSGFKGEKERGGKLTADSQQQTAEMLIPDGRTANRRLEDWKLPETEGKVNWQPVI